MNQYNKHLWKIGVLGSAALALVATAGGCSLLGDEPVTAGSIVGSGIGMIAPPIIGDIGGDLVKHAIDDTAQQAEAEKQDPAERERAKKSEEMERARDYDQMRRLKESNPEKYKQMTGREAQPK